MAPVSYLDCVTWQPWFVAAAGAAVPVIFLARMTISRVLLRDGHDGSAARLVLERDIYC